MLQKQLEYFIHQRCTLLGVGPVSKNVVDATIELANEYEIPIFLIASRRQIEAREFGGGYVNKWSTEDFSEYVREKDKKGKVILARDHGGPWQNEFETNGKYSLHKAMASAKRSFQVDIESGFQAVHIDPSIDIWGLPNVEEVLLRTYELYEFCWEVAQKNNRKIVFEIGMEEQSGRIGSLDEIIYTLTKVRHFCTARNLPQPSFIVIQTGTKVAETKNIGSVSTPFRIAYELPAEIQIPKMIDICNQNQVYLKQHNTDYLPDEVLSLYPKLGIHSANVAPEFGVAETKALIGLLSEHKLEDFRNQFLNLAHNSMKWKKWMLPDTKADNTDKAVIAGHYVFSTPECVKLKEEIQKRLTSSKIDLEEYLKTAVKKSILRYLKNFRLLRFYENSRIHHHQPEPSGSSR